MLQLYSFDSLQLKYCPDRINEKKSIEEIYFSPLTLFTAGCELILMVMFYREYGYLAWVL